MTPNLPGPHYALPPLPGARLPRIEPPRKLIDLLEQHGTNLREAMRVWDTACAWVRNRAPALSDSDVLPIAMLYFAYLHPYALEHGPMEREAMKYGAVELLAMVTGEVQR